MTPRVSLETIRSVFHARSAAVVGASAATGKLGHMILSNLMNREFPGPVYPVNPKEWDILGLKAYPSLAEIPEPIDLVIVTIPSSFVPDVIAQAASRAVRAAIIVSAGFSETETEEGRESEERIRRIALDSDMAVIGPNCQGVLSARGRISAWFGPLPDKAGKAVFITQSGGLAGTLIDWANRRGIGLFDSVVSLGNKCSIDEADLLEAFAEDPAIQLAMCYIEGFGPGRGKAFMEAAKIFSEHKPVVVLKGGRSISGERATSSHTGSLAGSDRVFTGAMAQAGVHLTESVREFINAARLAAAQGIPQGKRVLILTNLGGPGVITADICERYGLEVIPTPKAMRERLHRRIPAYCAVGNPIDLTGDPDPERYGSILDLVYTTDAYDCVLIVASPMAGSVRVASDIVRAHKAHPKATAVCWMSENTQASVRSTFEENGLPVFEMPEDAARALAALTPTQQYPQSGIRIERG